MHNPTVILNSIQDPGLGMIGQMSDMPVALSRGFRVKHGMTECDVDMVLSAFAELAWIKRVMPS
jgi:hypothetical protein